MADANVPFRDGGLLAPSTIIAVLTSGQGFNSVRILSRGRLRRDCTMMRMVVRGLYLMSEIWQSLLVIYTWGGEAHETRGVSQQLSMSCAAVRAHIRSFHSALAVRSLLLLLQKSGAQLTDYEIVTNPALKIAS